MEKYTHLKCVVNIYKKFIINRWYLVISCGIIYIMSTKYILLTAFTGKKRRVPEMSALSICAA